MSAAELMSMTDIQFAMDGRQPGADGVPRDWPRRRWVLSCEQWLPRGIDEVFDFFADAGNLNELTPPSLNFRILTPSPIAMHEGTLIDYSIRLRGIPMRWRTRISTWEPGRRFVDEQLRGPYALWHHEHTFEARDGGTLVRDRVTYCPALAWAPGAGWVHRGFVQPELRRIFAYRREQMARLFPPRRNEAGATGQRPARAAAMT